MAARMTDATERIDSASRRFSVGGFSLLLLVALTLQVSAGVLDPGAPARTLLHHEAAVRGVAEAVTRQAARPVRGEAERPVGEVGRVRDDGAELSEGAPNGAVGFGVRRLAVQLTDLPPPRRG